MVAHSLGTISTYLALRFGWLGTERLVLVAPMVEAESLFDQFQAALGFGSRTRRAFDRQVDDFVGIPMAEFDAIVQAVARRPGADPRRARPAATGRRRTPTPSGWSTHSPTPGWSPPRGSATGGSCATPRVVAEVVEFVRNGERAAAA